MVTEDPATITILSGGYQIEIVRNGFRFGFRRPDGRIIAPPHPVAGLAFSRPGEESPAPVRSTELLGSNGESLRMRVTNTAGITATVTITPSEDTIQLQVAPQLPGTYVIDAQTAAPGKGYGMGDWGGATALNLRDDDMSDAVLPNRRFVSNFAVFPAQGFAQVLFWEGRKRVQVDAGVSRLGVAGARSLDGLHYFVGDMPRVYAAYRIARQRSGYPDARPKASMFEVGWEAYGALGWNTSQQPVVENIREYLDRGYRLGWAVVGSRTWRGDPTPITAGTTRFGLWDDGSPGSTTPPRYPDPAGFKQFFRQRNIKLLIGLRLNMDRENPFYHEARQRGFLISDTLPLVDTRNPAALDWYIQGANLWGVDGFKEDLCCGDSVRYRDGKINPANERLMAQGSYVIVRNGAWAAPGDLVRREDTEYRGYWGEPADMTGQAIAYAASAAPNYYPDIVGGTNLQFKPLDDNLRRYVVRNAAIAAAMPGMAFGFRPWLLGDERTAAHTKAAADWHTRHAPYIFSAALASYETGYPHTLTPLMIAYPDRPELYDLRPPQWMLGPSLMAVGACYERYDAIPGDECTAEVRLPPGRWLDPLTGQTYQGPGVIPRWPLPLGKVPVLVGGTGIVVERELASGRLLAKVYPVAPPGALLSFTHPDGTSRSQIGNDVTRWDPRALTVIEKASGARVEATIEPLTGAVVFPIAPGSDYRLTTEYRTALPVVGG